MGEDGGTAISTCFDKDCLGQFKVEVSSCLRGLVWDMRSMALQPPPFIPRGKRQRNLSDSNKYLRFTSWGAEFLSSGSRGNKTNSPKEVLPDAHMLVP